MAVPLVGQFCVAQVGNANEETCLGCFATRDEAEAYVQTLTGHGEGTIYIVVKVITRWEVFKEVREIG